MAQVKSLHSCRYFDQKTCLSCTELGSPLLTSRSAKEELLHLALERFTTSRTIIEPIFGKEPFQSRTRIKMAVGGTESDPSFGFTKDLVVTDISECPLHVRPTSELLSFLKRIISEFKLTPYDIEKRTGELKYILLHFTRNSEQSSLRFVLRSTEAIGRIKKAITLIQSQFKEVSVVSANIQPQPSAVVEGHEEIILTDASEIWDTYNDTKICFTPQSFSQVNHDIAEALYTSAAKIIARKSPKSIFDLYCGVGCFSLIASPHYSWGIGIEINELSIAAAKQSCKQKGIDKLEFKAKDTLEFLNNYAGETPELIIVNPPRRGLDEKLCQRMLELSPKYILYASCNQETLVNDIERLEGSYQLAYLKTFDMFPLTRHLETLVLLEKSAE